MKISEICDHVIESMCSYLYSFEKRQVFCKRRHFINSNYFRILFYFSAKFLFDLTSEVLQQLRSVNIRFPFVFDQVFFCCVLIECGTAVKLHAETLVLKIFPSTSCLACMYPKRAASRSWQECAEAYSKHKIMKHRITTLTSKHDCS